MSQLNKYLSRSMLMLAVLTTRFDGQENLVKGRENPTPPQYEVVSIHPHRESTDGVTIVKIGLTANGFVGVNVTLKALIAFAYSIQPNYVFGGPEWIGDKAFDIQAKLADQDVRQVDAMPFEARKSLLKAVLKDRFGLVVRTEDKSFPVLTLTAPIGVKRLKRSKEQDSPANPITPKGYVRYGLLKVDEQTMPGLANQLAFPLQQRVIDKTGLTGTFDIILRWTPGEGEVKFRNDAGLLDDGPSIYTALWEQLGLKLEKGQFSSQKLFVVFVQTPSAN